MRNSRGESEPRYEPIVSWAVLVIASSLSAAGMGIFAIEGIRDGSLVQAVVCSTGAGFFGYLSYRLSDAMARAGNQNG